jgi:hypothetical protein
VIRPQRPCHLSCKSLTKIIALSYIIKYILLHEILLSINLSSLWKHSIYSLLLIKLLLYLPFLVIHINTPSQHTANWGKIKKIIITTNCSKVFPFRLYLFRKSEGKEPPLTFVQLFTYSIIYVLCTTRKTVIIRLLLLVEIANLYWF